MLIQKTKLTKEQWWPEGSFCSGYNFQNHGLIFCQVSFGKHNFAKLSQTKALSDLTSKIHQAQIDFKHSRRNKKKMPFNEKQHIQAQGMVDMSMINVHPFQS